MTHHFMEALRVIIDNATHLEVLLFAASGDEVAEAFDRLKHEVWSFHS